MMEWLVIISDFLTNGLRLILGLYLLARLMDVELDRKAIGFSVLGSVLVTLLDVAGLPVIGIMAVELAVILAVTWRYLREQLRVCLFLIIFYEMGVALWEFLISAGLGLLFHSARFMDKGTIEYLVSVWLMRLLMVAAAVLLVRKSKDGKSGAVHLASIIAVLGLFGVISLSEQTVLPISSDQFITWTIFSVLLMFAILLYRLNRQHEMEAEIAKLKAIRDDEVYEYAKQLQVPLDLAKYVHENGRLPVVNFAAGGVATPADAALMMQLGADGVFVGSGIFKSGNPEKRAAAIVKAVTNYTDAKLLAEVSEDLGEAMVGINKDEIEKLENIKMAERGQ